MNRQTSNKIVIPFNRLAALVNLDVLSVFISTFMGLYVRYDFRFATIPTEFLERAFSVLWINILAMLFFFWIFKLYKSIWRFASTNELLNISVAVLCCAIIQLVAFMFQDKIMPRSYYFFYGFSMMVFTSGIRFSYRILRIINAKRTNFIRGAKTINTMIIGAGVSGNAILKEIEASPYVNMHVSCVIDDNSNCHGKFLRGVPIVGGRDKIVDSVEKFGIDEIIVAIPSATKVEVRKVLEICKETGCKIRILPGMYQLLNGDVSVSQLREVDIEDLLGREPIQVYNNEIYQYIQDKVVLVTGGGGSIGSELCRQIAAHLPKQLIILDIYENNAYEIQQELLRDYPNLDLKVLIASIRNENRINSIFQTYRPQIVYHAAAHKHVPLMEESPNEAIKNNVFGTLTTVQAADRYQVEKFVLISTDKAVNPTNIMGASKRICEMIVYMMGSRSKTDFFTVRFGNVLGSNGSVIPLFKKQISKGGPVTVTHPDIVRYFMTIPEAVSLVLQAGAHAKGGEIFVLDMGEPVKILELAKNLIKLSGYRVDEDIQIVYTGLRPGEKMYEELLIQEEGLEKTSNKMIFIGKPVVFDETAFEQQLVYLKEECMKDSENIKKIVKEIVETYKEV